MVNTGNHKYVRLLGPVEPRHAEEIESVFGPNGVRYTEVGLELPPGLPEDICLRGLSTLNKIRNSIEFAIGDMLNYMEGTYGDTYTQAMNITGLSYSTLSGYKWVSGIFPISERRAGVSFSHHADVISLMDGYPDQAYEILDRALEEGLTSREVRFDVRQAKHDLGLDTVDAVEGVQITRRHEVSVRSVAHEVTMEGDIVEVSASVEWLDDLLDIVVALSSAEPPAYSIVRERAVNWCQSHGIPLQLPEPELV